MIKIKSDTLKFLFKVFTSIFSIIGLLFAISEPKKESDTIKSSIFQVDMRIINAEINKMSLDEKLSQLVIFNAGNITSERIDSITNFVKDEKIGGVFSHFDSVNTAKKFVSQCSDSSIYINPLIGIQTTSYTPDFLDIEEKISSLSFNAARDSILKQNYRNTVAAFVGGLGFDFYNTNMVIANNDDSIHYKDYIDNIVLWDSTFLASSALFSFRQSVLYDIDSGLNYHNKAILRKGITSLLISLPTTKHLNITRSIRSQYLYRNVTIVDLEGSDIQQDTIVSLLKNGVDFFLTGNPKDVKSSLRDAIESKLISQKELDSQVARNLSLKHFSKAMKKQKLSNLEQMESQILDLKIMTIKLLSSSICLLNNKNNTVPLKNLTEKKIDFYIFGSDLSKEFENVCRSYAESKFNRISKLAEKEFKFSKNSKITVIVFNNYTPDSLILQKIEKYQNQSNAVIINIGNPKNLSKFENLSSILLSFGNSEIEQQTISSALFGGSEISGKLPATYSKMASYGNGVLTPKIRLRYALPEEAGLDSEKLADIDSIMNDAIMRGAFPGGQVYVAKKGMIVYEKSYGALAYSTGRNVRNSDIYDLASVTKIAATTTAAMFLFDNGKLKLDAEYGQYFKDHTIDYSNIKADTVLNIDTFLYREVSDYKKILKFQDTLRINDSMFMAYDTLIFTVTPKRNIFNSVTIRDLLLHRSGVAPAMPILPYLLYKSYVYQDLKKLPDSIKYRPKEEIKKRYAEYFAPKYIRDSAEIRIAEGFYLQNRYFDTLWNDTKRLRVYSRKVYQYTDVNMILLQLAIDSITKKPLDEFLLKEIYEPLGMFNTNFKAWKHFDKERIAPTEQDKYWREQLLRGDVHDQSAALMGGVAGNAGLFSTAHDLGILGQMWLNGGTYGGKRYFTEETVKLFSGNQAEGGRGLGFDRATPKSMTGKGTPPAAYGHTGFTGTCIWIDPENEIVFVFVSNRVHPSAKNFRINGLQVRQKVQAVIYESIKNDKINPQL